MFAFLVEEALFSCIRSAKKSTLFCCHGQTIVPSPRKCCTSCVNGACFLAHAKAPNEISEILKGRQKRLPKKSRKNENNYQTTVPAAPNSSNVFRFCWLAPNPFSAVSQESVDGFDMCLKHNLNRFLSAGMV